MTQNTNEQLTNPFAGEESVSTKEALVRTKETFSQDVAKVKASLSNTLDRLSSVGASLDSFIVSLDSVLETASDLQDEAALDVAKKDLEKKATLIISVVGILKNIDASNINIIEVLGEINIAAEEAGEKPLSLNPEQQKVLINDILGEIAQELSTSQETLKKFKNSKVVLYHSDQHGSKHAVVKKFYEQVFQKVEGILGRYMTFFTDNVTEYPNEAENKKCIANAFATEKFYQDNLKMVEVINQDSDEQTRSEAVEKLRNAIRNYTGDTLVFLGEDTTEKGKSVLIGVVKAAYIEYLDGGNQVDKEKLGIGKTMLSPLLDAVKAAMVYKSEAPTNPPTLSDPILDLASLFSDNNIDLSKLDEGNESDDELQGHTDEIPNQNQEVLRNPQEVVDIPPAIEDEDRSIREFLDFFKIKDGVNAGSFDHHIKTIDTEGNGILDTRHQKLREAKEVTLGDAHGSALKILHALVASGFVERVPDGFCELYETSCSGTASEYPEDGFREGRKEIFLRDSSQINRLCEMIEQITFRKVEGRKFRLIGDIVMDRGLSDRLTLTLLSEIRKQLGPDQITMLNSNHDLEAFWQIRDNAHLPTPEALCLARLDQMQSGYELIQMFQDAPAPDPVLVDMYKEHLGQLKLFDYTVDEEGEVTDVYTHAPVPKTLFLMIKQQCRIAENADLQETFKIINQKHKELMCAVLDKQLTAEQENLYKLVARIVHVRHRDFADLEEFDFFINQGLNHHYGHTEPTGIPDKRFRILDDLRGKEEVGDFRKGHKRRNSNGFSHMSITGSLVPQNRVDATVTSSGLEASGDTTSDDNVTNQPTSGIPESVSSLDVDTSFPPQSGPDSSVVPPPLTTSAQSEQEVNTSPGTDQEEQVVSENEFGENYPQKMVEVYELFFRENSGVDEIKEKMNAILLSQGTEKDSINVLVNKLYNTLAQMADREKRRFVEQYIAGKFADEERKKTKYRKTVENLFSGNWKGVSNFLKPLLAGKTYGLMALAGAVTSTAKTYTTSSATISGALAGVYSVFEEFGISRKNKKIQDYAIEAEQAFYSNESVLKRDRGTDLQFATMITALEQSSFDREEESHDLQLDALRLAMGTSELEDNKKKRLQLEYLRILNEKELGDRFVEATTRYKTKRQGLKNMFGRFARNWGTIYAISTLADSGLLKRVAGRFGFKALVAGVETTLEGLDEKEIRHREEQLRQLVESQRVTDQDIAEWGKKVYHNGLRTRDLLFRAAKTGSAQGVAAALYGEAFNAGMKLPSLYENLSATNTTVLPTDSVSPLPDSIPDALKASPVGPNHTEVVPPEPQSVAYNESRVVGGKSTTWNTGYANQYNVTHPTTEMVGEIDIDGDGTKEAVTLMSETEARSGDGESRMLARLVKSHNLFDGDQAKIHQWKVEQLERLGIRYETETVDGVRSTKVIRSTVIHTGLKMQLFVDGSGNPHVQYATGGNNSLISVSKYQHEYGVRDGRYVDLADHAQEQRQEQLAEHRVRIVKTEQALNTLNDFVLPEIEGIPNVAQAQKTLFENHMNHSVLPAIGSDGTFRLNQTDGESVADAIRRELAGYGRVFEASIQTSTETIEGLDSAPSVDRAISENRIPLSESAGGEFPGFREAMEVTQAPAADQTRVESGDADVSPIETTGASTNELINSLFLRSENAPKVVGGGAEEYASPHALGLAQNSPENSSAYQFYDVPRTSGEFIISKDGSAVRVLIDGEQKIIVEKNVVFSKNTNNALTMDVGVGPALVIDGLSVDDRGVVTYQPSSSSTSGRPAAPFTSDQLPQLNSASSN